LKHSAIEPGTDVKERTALERWFGAIAALIVALLAWCAYSNGAAGEFVFDDHVDITDNTAIREPWPPWRVIIDQGQSGVSGRPVVALSYALNYEWCGYETWGWHVVNVAIHALTALFVVGCIRRALQGPPFAAHWRARAPLIALCVGALFTVHPLSTGVIMYRGQRVESLMALCFAATLYFALRAFECPDRKLWTRCAIAACALGTGCKEVIVGVPVLVLLYDALFVAGSLRAAWAQRRVLHGGLFASWALIAVFVLLAEGRSESVGFGYEDVGVWEYLTTQAWAVPHYLGLVVWPHPLVFDYGTRPIVELARWLPGGLIVLALLAVTAFGLARRRGWAFLGAWWFVILAPTSSVLPIVTEIIVEHRAYLPGAAVLLGVALLAARLLERVPPKFAAAIAIALTTGLAIGGTLVTRARNRVYHVELELWADTVAKLPENDRAHTSLGNDLRVAGRIAEAGEQYAEAVRLSPDNSYWRANYGTWLLDQGLIDEAIAELERSRELLPTYGMTLQNLATAYQRKGERDKALEAFVAALHAGAPQLAYVAQQAAQLLAASAREPEALDALRRGVRGAPADPDLALAAARALLDARDPKLRAPTEALSLAQRVYALRNGTDANALELAARALGALERFTEAAATMRSAAAVWRVNGQAARADSAERQAVDLEKRR
jgi:tetratricopeptide (TPR) repeat protein